MSKRISGKLLTLTTATIPKSLFTMPFKSLFRKKRTTKELIITTFNDANNFYKSVTGLDELEYYHDRVVELQKSLNDAQVKRRNCSYMLNDVRKRGIDIQDRLHKVKRYDEPTLYLQLMQQETDIIKRERELFNNMTEQERYEREVFTALTNAIRDSQEKQRNRLEYAKYIGFGLTVIGALVSYLITSWRQEDLKQVITTSIRKDLTELAMLSSNKNSYTQFSKKLDECLQKLDAWGNSIVQHTHHLLHKQLIRTPPPLSKEEIELRNLLVLCGGGLAAIVVVRILASCC